MAPEYSSAQHVLKKAFNRWPTWMWANIEVVELVDWLYNYNQSQSEKKWFLYLLTKTPNVIKVITSN